MEPIFEYRYTANDDFLRKMYKYLIFKRPPRPVLFIVFGALWLVIVGFTVALAVMESLSAYLVISAVTYTLCLVMMVVPYFTAVSARKKQIGEMYGGKYPEDYVTFDDEGLHMGVNGALTTATPYAQMKTLYETEDAVVLTTGARLVYFLAKEGFVKGTPAELKEFLRGKGVNVQKRANRASGTRKK